MVIITGGNTGIGKETAIDLAKRGAIVYIACRDKKRGEDACKEIIQESKNTKVFYRNLDLSSLASVRTFCENFLAEGSRLDILINNAAMIADRHDVTVDGFEFQFGVNHLGPFLLTNLLLERLKSSAPSRIVNVTGKIYINCTPFDRDDIFTENSPYHPINVYAQTKLANIMFTRDLVRRLSGTRVTVNTLHPGVIHTGLSRNLRLNLFKFRWTPNRLTRYPKKSVKSGAQTTIYAAVDPDLENVTGEYFEDCEIGEYHPKALDEDTTAWLWRKSVELTKLPEKFL